MRGQGRIFQRGGKWWIAYYAPVEGKSTEQRESAGRTEPEAKRLLRKRLQEIAVARAGVRQFQGPRQERITVEELLSDLETDYEIRGRRSLPQLKSQLKHIRAFFAMDRALAVTTDRVRHYILNRQKEGAAPATVNREVVALQAAFSLAVESEPQKLSYTPRFLTLPEDNTRQGFFDRADLEAVARLLPEDLQDFARFGFLTGWRSGEIKSLAWSEFDLETRQLRLRGANSKNGEPRKLTLTDELWEIVERRWKARAYEGDNGETVLSPLVFYRVRGKGVKQTGEPVQDFRKAWKAACESPGVAGRLFHDLRRTAARNLRRAGVSEEVAMLITGHKTTSVFKRYNITDDRDLEDALRRAQAYVRQLPKERTVVRFERQETVSDELQPGENTDTHGHRKSRPRNINGVQWRI
jgi:integrase